MTDQATSARDAAFQALDDLSGGRIDRLDERFDRMRALDDRDAGLARELALGAVRYQRLYDHLAARFLKRGPQPPPLMIALRLACHQLFALDRVPPHAAVHETVESLRRAGHRKLVPVANAVMRRLSEMRQDTRIGDGPLGRIAAEDQPDQAAVRHSVPDRLLDDLRPVLPDGNEDALASLNLVPHLCTRTRPGRPQPSGASVLKRDGALTWWDDPQEALRGPVADGICVVQDAAQGDVVRMSGARPGDLVLDCCSAPGGKAVALADRGCRVIAADLSIVKLRSMREPAIRLAQDGCAPALAAGAFDVVLVDAPCSNSGVIARRPEARWRYEPKQIASLERLQGALLRAGAALVAPGGRLVYSTCSLVPRENQAIAHRLVGWRLLMEQLSWPDAWRGGGYVAVLVRS
ncbi:MAG: hypothetical protein H0V44_09175 [Planctomycetes bacterium]|nr:hypothetical protein [Planctomycetota bacterium]